MFHSNSTMMVKFASDGKDERAGAIGCKVSCKKAVTTTTTENPANTTTVTTTSTSSQPTTTDCMTLYEIKINNEMKKMSECRKKCNADDTCKHFQYKVTKTKKVSKVWLLAVQL